MTVQRIDPRRLPSEVRRVNRGLMAQFIGADPYGRRHLSPRKSIVLYNGEGHFKVCVEREAQRAHAPQAVPGYPPRLWSFINIAEEDRPLLLAIMIDALIQLETPKPITGLQARRMRTAG